MPSTQAVNVGAAANDRTGDDRRTAFMKLQAFNVQGQPYNATGNGTTDDRAALAAADVAVTLNNGGVVTFPVGTYRVATNLQITNAVQFLYGGILKPDSGVTVTISGAITASLTKCFDTSAGGRIIIGDGKAVHAFPQWWGAKGDASVSDAVAFQACVSAFNGPGVMRIPAGFYNIDAPILMPTGFAFMVEGEHKQAVQIACTSAGAMTDLFSMQVASNRYEGCQFKNFSVVGNSKLACVIDSFPSGLGSTAYASHTLIENVGVQGTTLYCFRLNSCYSSTFRDLELFSNTGGGFAAYGSANNQNNVTFDTCNVYANTGVGLTIGNGLNVTVRSCGVEQNAAGGILAFDMRSLNIVEGYIERNGNTGTTFTTPALTVRADIMLHAGTTPLVADLTGNLECVTVARQHATGYNTGTGSAGVQAYVWTNKGDKLTIESNQLYDSSKYTNLLEIYDPVGTAVISPVTVRKNTVDSVHFSAADVFNAPKGAHWIEIERTGTQVNYVPQDFNAFAAQAGTTGTRVRSATGFGVVTYGDMEYPTFDLTTGDTVWGPIITPVADDLKSQWVYFGLWFKPGATAGSNVQIQMTGYTDVTATDVTNQSWQFKSCAALLGASPANVQPLLKKLGVSSAVTLGPMIVARVGDAARLFPTPAGVRIAATAAPTVGTWKVGARVINSVPTVGQPKAWVCTVAGTPGTWVSEGNL